MTVQPIGAGTRRRRRHRVAALLVLPTAAIAWLDSTSARADAPLPVRVEEIGSDRVTLAWDPGPGATRARVLLLAEPGTTAPSIVVATLPGDGRRHTVRDLAPAVNAFFRVEVQSPGGMRVGTAHARTLGGPRARLDGAAREVHVLAPDVLEIVLARQDGAAWQAGPWTIRRNGGAPIEVARVHRRSLPVSQPDFPLGFGASGGSDRVEVDHHVAIVLGAPIGSPEVLTVRGPNDLTLLLPFSDRYLETTSIQLNQVGYNPRAARRWAYVSGWLGDGGPLRLDRYPARAQVVGEPPAADRLPVTIADGLPIETRSRSDRDAGAEVRQIDLSSVPPAEGRRLRVRVPGVGVSWPTEISERAAFKAFFVVARGLFHNRWAGDLRASLTEWSRPADHTSVYVAEQRDPFEMFPRDTPRGAQRALRGGYHDAGDFDQRPMHTVVPQLLMRAYEIDSGRFLDGQLLLPESGNGVPDLLDEALWGVAAWEALQERDGGVRGGVESFRHPWGYYPAHEDQLPYFTFSRDANVTARAAGLFAQAAHLLRSLDPDRSRSLRRRAVRAFAWARHSDARPEFLLYAASELARLTGDAEHARAFEALWGRIGPEGAFSRFTTNQLSQGDYVRDARVMPDYLLGYLGSARPAVRIVDLSRTRLDRHARAAADAVLDSPVGHRTPRPAEWGTDWGMATVTAQHLDTVFARLSLGGLPAPERQRLFDALSLAADYVLGANPAGMSWISGLGSRRPEEPLHLDSLVAIRRGKGPVPGIPVFGPVGQLPAASYYDPGRRAFYPAFEAHPPMLRYADLRTFVNTNEFTVWSTQAPHVELFATLLGPGRAPPASFRPGGRDHASPLP